jgi:hypothetical protein
MPLFAVSVIGNMMVTDGFPRRMSCYIGCFWFSASVSVETLGCKIRSEILKPRRTLSRDLASSFLA